MDPRLSELTAIRAELDQHLMNVIRGLSAGRSARWLAAQLNFLPDTPIPGATNEPFTTLAEVDAMVTALETEQQRIREAIRSIDATLARLPAQGGVQ